MTRLNRGPSLLEIMTISILTFIGSLTKFLKEVAFILSTCNIHKNTN